MPTEPKSSPSFSSGRRWRIGFDVLLRTALVLAIVVMANFISTKFFGRFYLSSATRTQLSAHTLSVLQSITNHIVVTLYYDQSDEMYPTISALVKEYQLADPNISVQTVDYVRDDVDAQKIKEQYKLDQANDKDLVIFDNNGRYKIAPGDELVKYSLQQIPDPKEQEPVFRNKPVAFNGEMMFTTLLLAVSNPKPFKAYYLQGEGEPVLTDKGDNGYYKFATEIAQNYIDIEPLSLGGSGAVPDDCDLLIIAGPHGQFPETELNKIDQYLVEGGRLFALFDYNSIKNPTGLEPVLQRRCGVNIGYDWVSDIPNSPTGNGQDILISNYAKHPVVDSLVGNSLYLVLPRPISKVDSQNPPPDAPEVDELAFSGPGATLSDSAGAPPQTYPLMAAVEQKATAGVTSPRGLMRAVIVGDSFAFENKIIGNLDNRDFVGYAVNWLLGQSQMLAGIGPKPVTEYKLVMTQSQQETLRWLLLGALPGGVLLLGGLVWLVRRK